MSDPETKPKILNNEAYARWLRAQKPDETMFYSLNEEEQETLAMIGEAYQEDYILGLASAILSPVETLAAGGDKEAEEDIATRVGQALLERISKGTVPSTPFSPETPGGYTDSPYAQSPREVRRDPLANGPVTMGGREERRGIRKAQEVAEISKSKTLFGRSPDHPEEANE